MKLINKILYKSALRDISKTRSRFFSIFAIVLIGVSFFTGLTATSPDMTLSADTYYDENNLMDFRMVSSMGFNENDIEAINSLNSGITVYPAYFTDVLMTVKNASSTARVLSIPSDNSPSINYITIAAGRMPEKENECIIIDSSISETYYIGSEIKLEGDLLLNDTFTIVGSFMSPMFIDKSNLGSTTIGEGVIDSIIYIPEKSFDTEYYTEVYITIHELKEYNSYSSEYENRISEVMAELEKIADEREVLYISEMTHDAYEKIAEAELELENAEQEGISEFQKIKSEFDTALKDLETAEKQFIEGKTELEDGWKALDNARVVLTDGKNEYDLMYSEFISEINNAKQALEQEKNEFNRSKNDYNINLEEYNTKSDEYNQGLSEYRDGLMAYTTAFEEFQERESGVLKKLELFNTAFVELTNEMLALDTILENIFLMQDEAEELEKEFGDKVTENSEYNELKENLSASEKEYQNRMTGVQQTGEKLNNEKKLIDEHLSIIEKSNTEFVLQKTELDKFKTELDSAKEQLEIGEKELSQIKNLIENGETALSLGEQELLKSETDGLNRFAAEYDKLVLGENEINNNQKLLEEKQSEYDKGLSEYNLGIEEYRSGLEDYNTALEEFNFEINKAGDEIESKKTELSNLKNPEWYIFDRSINPGNFEYGENSERIRNISKVFPVFFLLVAALVCFTTIHRMVEENRLQIGTLKSLGYGNSDIVKKYLIYAVSATILGTAAGALIGMKLFPFVIISAYQMLYNIPIIILPYNLFLTAITLVAAIFLVTITVVMAAYEELKEEPSQLIRPKVQKKGKRVLIEKIPFIWNRLNFSNKVTARNIFRYKRRMLMTVVGISGCTALLLTGFSLNDSISAIAEKQFEEIHTYQGSAVLNDDFSDDNGLKQIFEENNTEYLFLYQKQHDISANGKIVKCYIVVPDDEERFNEFVNLRNRKTGEPIDFESGSGILSEKALKLLNIKGNGTVNIEGVNSEPYSVKGSAENYISNYLYMTMDDYYSVFSEPPLYNIVYYKNSLSDEENSALTGKLLKDESIVNVIQTNLISNNLLDSLGSLSLVIFVIIVAAGSLAFVVMYNLTNININERIREIATLKVLGFYDMEVDRYIFKENIMLTLIGNFVGLVLGVLLSKFVIETAEIDMIMFGREIEFMSFVYASILTMLFSCLVTVFMHRRLLKVDMAASLKTVE